MLNVPAHPAITEPTEANITDLLTQIANDAKHRNPDGELIPLELFCPPEDIASIQEAHQWWPKAAPPNMSWARMFGGTLSEYGFPNGQTTTLLERLWSYSERVVAWLKSEKRDVKYPNATRSERMKLMNTERVKQWRLEKAAGGPSGVDTWLVVREARAARAAAKAHHDGEVRDAQRRMMDEVEHRKVVLAHHDELVGEAEEAHRLAKDPEPDLTAEPLPG